ncbi:hypothetical protein HKX48_006969 [Thoreauomyces humboldtii]|nr:hypothetical protein HKX48_006969 [Thoreauomyces humboldtii]
MKIFKGNRQNTMAFGHSVYTDGISVSISMQPPGAKERRHRKKKGPTKAQQKRTLDATYFPNHIDELRAAPNIVYIDPNKRDLLYCMDEQGQKLRHTSMQRDKETKRRVFAKREVRQQELRDLVFPPSKTMNLTAFANFIHFHVQHTTRLKEFYASQDNAHALERLQAYSLKQRSEAKLISAMKSKFGQHFTIVLGDWSDGGHTAKFQTSSKTSGWRKTFTAAKIPWFLIDEYLTSSICPIGEQVGEDGSMAYHRVRKKVVPKRLSPRPWRAKTGQLDYVHGLLGCDHPTCIQQAFGVSNFLQGRRVRYFNRDTLSVRNMRTIVQSHLQGNGRPEAFRRGRQGDGGQQD